MSIVDVVKKGSVLCTDGHPVYPSVALDCGALHKPLNIKAGVKVVENSPYAKIEKFAKIL